MVDLLAFNAFFYQQHILQGLSVTFRRNTISAIIGPSGSGKTTLLRSINRTAELQPGFSRNGNIFVDQKDIYSVFDPAPIRKKVGMVLQKPLAFPLSVQENLLFGPRYYGMSDKRELAETTETILRKVVLWNEVKDKLNSPANQLSGGQLQRLSIGRALAANPQVLLLDEPCSSLDVQATRMIEELLLNLRSQLTIIIVTHNLAQAKRLASETIFMAAGKIIETGATQQLFANPQSPETQEFLAF